MMRWGKPLCAGIFATVACIVAVAWTNSEERSLTGKDIYQAVAAKAPHLASRIVFTTGDGASEETLKLFREMGREILLKP